MFRVYHVLIAAVLLGLGAACSSLPAVDVQPAQKLHVDAYLLTPCDRLSDLVTNPTKTDTLERHRTDTAALATCAIKQAKLAAIVKKQIEVEQQ